ncbi:MAG: UvrD-helicase domain-containing protein [Candidatus Aminicenantes bacterium]|nr:UvrD-helicase domain-containing protein [Candidatus Aminicenantes bacterium]
MTKKTDLADREARLKIVRELDKTFLVEAGAGSGKTKSLVDRMLALLIAGRCRIQNLAAVTFTRKAAAELRGRFQTDLERELLGAGNAAVRARLEEALKNLEQCSIETIHSFCSRLLRERPIEISLDPEFKEMEEIEDALYRDKCWYDYMVKARLEDEETLQKLDDAGLAPEDLKDAFTTICHFPEVELMEGNSRKPDFSQYRLEFRDFLRRAKQRIPYEEPEKGFDQLQTVLRRCFMREKNLGFDDHRFLMETYELLDKEMAVKRGSWPSKEESAAFKKEFDYFRERVVEDALRQWREYRHSIILTFLKPAVAYFGSMRKARSRVNFEDLLIFASRLLKENPEVRRYFSRKYTHILVDEFQDTDPVQAEVLLYLSGTDCEERDWRKLSPRPGSLFLVGDPKQSIFRFRRADIDTYSLVKKQIERAGGEVLPLTANFRSMNTLRDWANPLFRDVFPKDFTPHQAAFAPLNTLRPDISKARSGVFKITVPRMERNKQVFIAQYDAGAIGDYIKWACEGNLRLARSRKERERGLEPEASPSDFMLLFRYRKNMQIYARALEDRGIPFEITGGGAFAESEEIREIVTLTKALNDPENPIFTVAVLRGIFFGTSDDELLNFKRRGGRFSFLQSFEEGNVNPGEGVTSRLMMLRQWWKWTVEYPASTALERIFETSGIINYLASTEMGSSKAGNLFKLLEILRGREREGETSFSTLAGYLDDLTSVFDIEEMSLTPGRADAVRLMNLHKAKGLEAPVVFLANPVGMKDREPDKHIVRTDKEGPRGYFLFERRGRYWPILLSQPAGWNEAVKEEKRYQAAEEMRLMYVAATRARNILVVSTYAHNLGERRAWGVLDDALDEVRELEISQKRVIEKREKLLVDREELDGARRNLRESVEIAVKPGYGLETVTALAKEGLEIPACRRGSLGMSWGRVVHRVLDGLGRSIRAGDEEKPDTNSIIENAMADEEMDLGEKERLQALIDSICSSALWERALNAGISLFEAPFSLKVKGRDLGFVGDFPVRLSGVIDLVFKEEGGWVIADYKTDEIVDDLQTYVDYYTPQIRIYSRFWAEITGELIKESGLYFTSIKRWIPV